MEVVKMDFSGVTPTQVSDMIKGTLSGDNQRIREATKFLKAYCKHQSSIRTLSYLLVNSEDWPVRQMTTVLLKRNLINQYGNLNEPEQAQFRAVLLAQYIKEPNIKIQKGIGLLIGILVSVVQFDKWAELKGLLQQALHSAPESPATLILLNTLLYHFKPPAELYTYIMNALSVPNLTEEAVKCLIAVAETQAVDSALATQLIQIWEKSNWSEEISLTCLEFLNILCERKIKMTEDIISWVCEKVVLNKKLSTKFRSAGLDFLLTVSEFQSKLLSSKESLLKRVIETICLVCSQPFIPHDDEDDDNIALLQDIAIWCIETMAVSLKTKKIYPILLDASMSFINSQDPSKCNTGFLVLSATTEGCSDRVRNNLQNPIMNVLIPRGLSHTSPEVRGAAINTLCYFAEHLIPEIIEYHSTIIPSMMNFMGDLSPKVAEQALVAIDIFFDNMDEGDITSYLPVVVPKLSEVLLSQNSTFRMKRASLSALGGAVSAAEAAFEPYVDGLMKICLQLLTIPPTPELNSVRAQNITVMGRLSNFFCRNEYANKKLFFDTYVLPNLEVIYSMLVKESDPQVRQACFSFFYLLANAIGQDFEHIFDKIIVEVLKSCEVKEPLKKERQDFSLDTDSEDDDVVPSTKATEYDQKAAAIHALGELAKACPMKFVPYFEQAFKLLEHHYQFFYDGVRIQVSNCYADLTLGFIKSQNNGVIPAYKKGLPCTDRYPQKIEEFFKVQLLPKLLFMMSEDESSKSSSVAIESLDELVKEIGPVLIDKSLDSIREVITKLLEAQNVQEDDEDSQEEQQEEDTDSYIFEPICDLIPTLAITLQAGFESTLHELHPYMMKFLEERDNINDNVQMAGCLSQIFKIVPSYVPSHAEELFLSLRALIALEDTDLNRNIAYSFAELFQKNPQAMMPHLTDCMVALKVIFEHKQSHDACKDNAMAALCRITYAIYPQMPYQAIFGQLMQRMPFSGDQEEEPEAIKAILYMSEMNPQILAPFADKIKQVFAHDIQDPKKYFLTPELITNMQTLLQRMQ